VVAHLKGAQRVEAQDQRADQHIEANVAEGAARGCAGAAAAEVVKIRDADVHGPHPCDVDEILHHLLQCEHLEHTQQGTV
jgi:hypothetical protein